MRGEFSMYDPLYNHKYDNHIRYGYNRKKYLSRMARKLRKEYCRLPFVDAHRFVRKSITDAFLDLEKRGYRIEMHSKLVPLDCSCCFDSEGFADIWSPKEKFLGRIYIKGESIYFPE